MNQLCDAVCHSSAVDSMLHVCQLVDSHAGGNGPFSNAMQRLQPLCGAVTSATQGGNCRSLCQSAVQQQCSQALQHNSGVSGALNSGAPDGVCTANLCTALANSDADNLPQSVKTAGHYAQKLMHMHLPLA